MEIVYVPIQVRRPCRARAVRSSIRTSMCRDDPHRTLQPPLSTLSWNNGTSEYPRERLSGTDFASLLNTLVGEIALLPVGPSGAVAFL